MKKLLFSILICSSLLSCQPVLAQCSAVSNVTVTPYQTASGNELYITWATAPAAEVGVFINNQLYVEPTSHYGLWPAGQSIWATCGGVSGGIQPNHTYKVFVISYCNEDTTGSPRFYSEIGSCTVPSTYNGTCISSGALPNKPKGKGK